MCSCQEYSRYRGDGGVGTGVIATDTTTDLDAEPTRAQVRRRAPVTNLVLVCHADSDGSNAPSLYETDRPLHLPATGPAPADGNHRLTAQKHHVGNGRRWIHAQLSRRTSISERANVRHVFAGPISRDGRTGEDRCEGSHLCTPRMTSSTSSPLAIRLSRRWTWPGRTGRIRRRLPVGRR